ncbi:hypothetical protein MMC07_006536 [Pseudocyphellaria aurata]|nr:hypothetical protein [Pseudocyphellaria aurata]
MTAVAPSLPLPLWNNGSGGQGGLSPMSADEVTRMFMPRKSAQRTNSSSSVASSSSGSSTYTYTAALSQSNGETPAANGDQGAWGPRKKPVKGLWPPSKAEPVSGISTARSQLLPAPSSGQSAASTMSAMHQPSPVVPSTNKLQPQSQQNGGRLEQSAGQSEPTAILALLPMTGTFERKHITVPYFPEVLRIGRQTNAKTVPTAINGYFDSKVLSRQHAEVWADRSGKIWIRDVKSSNGTFVNGVRLSPENRDSEPHELREHDTLELGIDIVSEDQKSIVHHKVSAKVEHAGIYGNGSNVLDLNFGDIDPNSGNGLLGPSINQPISQIRGRGGSQSVMGNNGRMAGPQSMVGSNMNGMGAQRQMNFWMSPITIEQVVKKLATELKQAKQQSQDLHRTSNFFGTLLTLEPGQELPKPPQAMPVEEPHTNGFPLSAQLDAISPFSQPPAPPPQQPLPEKPDIPRYNVADSIPQNSLKRVSTERSTSAHNSPTKPELPSSQILSLVEALTTAKREIDSQGDRVKQLEVLLKRERKARETAEERARRLLENHPSPQEGSQQHEAVEEQKFEPTLVSSEQLKHSLTNGCETNHTESSLTQQSTSPRTPDPMVKSAEELRSDTQSVDLSTSRLQERLDLMVREMDEMRIVMESYKRRAEGAEKAQKGLAEMVEQIRAGKLTESDGDSASTTTSSNNNVSPSSSAIPNSSPHPGSTDHTSLDSPSLLNQQQRLIGDASSTEDATDNIGDLQRPLSTALQAQRWGEKSGEVAIQSAPYVSMVGVVLIGVGIMTWLNGWQRERL